MDLQSLKIDRKPKPKPAHGRRRRAPVGMVVLALAALATWLLWPRVSLALDRLRLPAVRVLLVTQTAAAVAAAVSGTAANGHVVAARRAALSTDVPGRIVEMRVTEGSVVHKGDVVARLYSDEWKAALDRADADVAAADAAIARSGLAHESAKAEQAQAAADAEAKMAQRDESQALERWAHSDHERTAQLVRDGVLSSKDLDKAKSELDAALARVAAADAAQRAAAAAIVTATARVQVAAGDLTVARAQREVSAAAARQARATLEKTEVRAPFDGIVVLKDAEVGEVVSPNVQSGANARGAVCTLVDFASLEVQADVPETSLGNVRLGALADVYLDMFPSYRYAGRVDRIWPTADRQKATVEVRVKLLEHDERLRPELGTRIVFHQDAAGDGTESQPAAAPGQPAILVPEAALLQSDGRDGVFVLEQDRVRFQEVRLGERRGGRAVVESGLRPGQRIVADPPARLRDGDRVLIQEG